MGSPKVSLQFAGLLQGLLVVDFQGSNQLFGLGLLNGLGLDDLLLLFDEDFDSGDLLSDGSGGSLCGTCGLGLGQLLLLALKSGDG